MVVHRSKADAWLIAVLAISILAALYGAIVVAARGSIGDLALAAFITGIGAALPLWLMLSTRYTIRGDQLLVQCGPFTWRIKVAEITGITPTSNPLSSPALSLDRLRIDYGQRASLMISPRDKDKFLSDLEAARRGAA
ncbi:PH domain-containing protein [Alkalisalibacterium limincola]|uniref:PH domain-containing protein n=1 Tax=Alkalisalibacterium limincola TaxID=2699169 RepID=A0A5C8KFU8_9GAMM|nr:PH domain-containing protein [Alkalisalibacterium limincola]TXK59045.1 PH domain-containing protein [Alkalisalibacterium limincola]